MIGCKRCGRCCLDAEVWLDPTMDDKNAYFALKRTGAMMMWREGRHLKILVGRCPHLSGDGKTCLIYEERPDECKEHPISKGKVKPGCRYYDDFEE